MARIKYSKKRSNKIEPSTLTLTFATSTVGGGTPTVTEYVDLSQVASLVNRRFYRQGINWAVAGIKVLNLTGFTGTVQVSKLPNTWVMSNAWEKSFRTWTRMNNQALEENESVKPRFLDFKVYADHEHAVAGRAANMLPISYVGGLPTPAVAGEWEMSKVVVPETTTATGAVTEFELIATGASNAGAGASGLNSKSLIEGYAASRGLPNVLDPNTPDDAANYGENWMMAIFNEGTLQDATVNADMIDENNIAPYPFENDGVNLDTMYPGGANQLSGMQVHDSEFITPTTIGGTTRIKGGNFPCGLIRFDFANSGSESGLIIQLDLVPGNHRGYLCEPMTEM
jgi:hypothetical protein